MAMRPQGEKSQSYGFWKPFLVVLVLVAGVLAWAHFTPKPSLPLSFEITGFEGNAQIYDAQSRLWRTPKRGEEFRTGQKIRTEANGIVNLQVENEIRLRLKGDSELINKLSAVVEKKEVYRLHLERGILFGMTTKEFDRKKQANKAVLQITAPSLKVDVLGATFRVEAASAKGQVSKAGVMRGSVEASTPSFLFPKPGVRVRGLQEAKVIDGALQAAARVTQEEWGTLKEAYELQEKTAVKEAEQVDLSKKAGKLFEYVFDHGTFYTPKVGYAGREFYKDPDSGEVYLDTEYDVFPMGAFSGVYMKTRNFDVSQFEGLSFEVRKSPDEGTPDGFFVELKSKGNVVRRFAPHGFERTWRTMQFDFNAQKPMLVNEVALVFTNARAGEGKKGVIEMRNFNLIPKIALPPAVSKISEQKSVSVQTATKLSPVNQSAIAAPSVPNPSTPSAPSSLAVQSPAVPKEVPLE